MNTLSDGIEGILIPHKSEFKHLIEGGRTDHIQIVMELPTKLEIERGNSFYIGVVIEETFEPYGLQIQLNCYKLSKTHGYFRVDNPAQNVYELLLD